MSTVQSKTTASSSGGSSGGSSSGVTQTDKGYAYVDKYGFSHVVADLSTAQEYSADGNVQQYFGNYGGGYALDNKGNRVAVSMPGVIPYGNDERDKYITSYVDIYGNMIGSSANQRMNQEWLDDNDLEYDSDGNLKKKAITRAFTKSQLDKAENNAIETIPNKQTTSINNVPIFKQREQDDTLVNYNKQLRNNLNTNVGMKITPQYDAIGRRMAKLPNLFAGKA